MKPGDVFWLVLLLGMIGARICYNHNHPEVPLSWMDDPRFVVPYVIVLSVPVVWLYVRSHRKRGWEDSRCRRWIAMQAAIQRLHNSGRKQEAKEANQLYLRSVAARTEKEEVVIVNQFSDRFGL